MNEAIRAWEWHKKEKRTTFGLKKNTWLVCDSFKRSWRYAHQIFLHGGMNFVWQQLMPLTTPISLFHAAKLFSLKRLLALHQIAKWSFPLLSGCKSGRQQNFLHGQ